MESGKFSKPKNEMEVEEILSLVQFLTYTGVKNSIQAV